MFVLAGLDEPDIQGWYSLHEDMAKLVEMARARQRKPQISIVR